MRMIRVLVCVVFAVSCVGCGGLPWGGGSTPTPSEGVYGGECEYLDMDALHPFIDYVSRYETRPRQVKTQGELPIEVEAMSDDSRGESAYYRCLIDDAHGSEILTISVKQKRIENDADYLKTFDPTGRMTLAGEIGGYRVRYMLLDNSDGQSYYSVGYCGPYSVVIRNFNVAPEDDLMESLHGLWEYVTRLAGCNGEKLIPLPATTTPTI